MKHSMILKFLAVVLAAFSLVAAVGSAFGIIALESANLYINGLDELQQPLFSSISAEIATSCADLYAAENLGNLKELPYTLAKNLFADPRDRTDAEHWYVTLSQNGAVLDEAGIPSGEYAFVKSFTIAPLYFIATPYSPESAQDSPQATVSPSDPSLPTETQPEPERPENYLYTSQENYFHGGRFVTYSLDYYQAPEYTVTVYVREDVLDNSMLHLLTTIYPHRYSFIAILATSLLTAAICVVFLLNAAGCTADGTIRPGGLNRLPLDLYAAITAAATLALGWLFFRQWEWTENQGPHLGNLSLMGVNLLAVAVILIAFLFAFAAQIKAKNAFWWRHSVIGWCCGRIAAGFKLLLRGIRALRKALPLMWQWLLTAAFSGITTLILLILVGNGNEFLLLPLILDLLICVAVVLYSGWCFAALMKGVREMSQGNLGAKIDTRYLRGNFRDFAIQLNSLSETATEAARKQMRSERMKSELITNVSHDIKTPLTSIINFVDLLQKPHTPEQEREYLEVLARQSGRMKKLIEDLMELSRASSGNIHVNLQTMDAGEAVNQALGEFSDKLAAAGLSPIFQPPLEPLLITADGRLVWRVLSNLLGNAVKYALPGTRLYVDLLQVEDQVLLSLKNISREPMNMDAEELLERFVRGDTSRNSEGSGLGLNIAQNLMEVQGGQLQILLDGDLFKVTLIFPLADAPKE